MLDEIDQDQIWLGTYSYTLSKLPSVNGFVILATSNKCPFILAILEILAIYYQFVRFLKCESARRQFQQDTATNIVNIDVRM